MIQFETREEITQSTKIGYHLNQQQLRGAKGVKSEHLQMQQNLLEKRKEFFSDFFKNSVQLHLRLNLINSTLML